MKKNLTKRVVMALICMIAMMLNTSLAYTLTLQYGDKSLVTTRSVGSEITLQIKDPKYKIWEVLSGDITINENNKFIMPEKDVVLRASSEYQIRYDANGGENAPEMQLKIPGEDIELTTVEPTRKCYIFKGWSTSSSDTTVEYLPGMTYTTDADITLYAVWENIIYTVGVGTYIQHIPTADSATARANYTGYSSGDQTLTIDKNESTRMKYKVYANNNGQLDIISAEHVGGIYLEGTKGYAYGIFELNRLCEQYVNDYADTAVCLGSTRDWTSGMVDKYDVINKNRTLGRINTSSTKGWQLNFENTSSLSNTYPYEDSLYTNTIPLDSDGNMIPELRHSSGYVWVASRSFATDSDDSRFYVKRMYYDGTIASTRIYRYYDDGTKTPEAYTRGVRPVIYLKPGLLIVDGSGTADDPYIVDFDRTVYRITYNANSGDAAPITQLKTPGQALTLTTSKPTRVGYTFTGWNTNSDGTGTPYAAGATFEIDADTTLYAQWVNSTYTIKYNANGGSGTVPSTQTKTDDEEITLATNKLTRSGWSFYRWNTKADGSGTNYQSGATYTKNANATLYAIWVKIEEGPYEAACWQYYDSDARRQAVAYHEVDVTGINKVKFTAKYAGRVPEDTGYIKIEKGSTQLFYKTEKDMNGTFTIDVSEYTGKIKFTLYVDAVPDSTYYWASCAVKLTNIIRYASPAT